MKKIAIVGSHAMLGEQVAHALSQNEVEVIDTEKLSQMSVAEVNELAKNASQEASVMFDGKGRMISVAPSKEMMLEMDEEETRQSWARHMRHTSNSGNMNTRTFRSMAAMAMMLGMDPYVTNLFNPAPAIMTQKLTVPPAFKEPERKLQAFWVKGLIVMSTDKRSAQKKFNNLFKECDRLIGEISKLLGKERYSQWQFQVAEMFTMNDIYDIEQMNKYFQSCVDDLNKQEEIKYPTAFTDEDLSNVVEILKANGEL